MNIKEQIAALEEKLEELKKTAAKGYYFHESNRGVDFTAEGACTVIYSPEGNIAGVILDKDIVKKYLKGEGQ